MKLVTVAGILLCGLVITGCSAPGVTLRNEAQQLERAGEFAEAARQYEAAASEANSAKLASRWFYDAAKLWLDPVNSERSIIRAFAALNQSDPSYLSEDERGEHRRWVELLKDLRDEKVLKDFREKTAPRPRVQPVRRSTGKTPQTATEQPRAEDKEDLRTAIEDAELGSEALKGE